MPHTPSTDLDRLSVVDEIFLRAHRGLGTPTVMQGLWLTDDPVDRNALAAVHTQLARGPLGRQVRRVPIPGARARWEASTRTWPIVYSAANDPVTWADAQGGDLDPSRGPGWRISACTLPNGSSLISLASSHVLADARGLIAAVDDALVGVSRQPDFAPHSDWSDARQTWRKVVKEFRPRPSRSASARTAPRPFAAPISAILTFSAPEFDRAAQESGSTPNSLFVHTVTSILYATGFPKMPVDVSLPVDSRAPGAAVIGNALAMGSTTIEPADSPADVRAKCGDGFGHRMSGPKGIPEEFLHLLPDRLAALATKGAGQLDVLCSNIGSLPDSLGHVGASRARSVAARAIHPGLTRLPRTRLSGYLCRSGDEYTLSLVSLDPENVRSRDELQAAAVDCLPVRATAW
ncbi:MAG: hypothetical protein LLG14_15745 [Nocardiaceae bacterium]|nr:hypothetical protein [Nocardiaceae bacterium]